MRIKKTMTTLLVLGAVLLLFGGIQVQQALAADGQWEAGSEYVAGEMAVNAQAEASVRAVSVVLAGEETVKKTLTIQETAFYELGGDLHTVADEEYNRTAVGVEVSVTDVTNAQDKRLEVRGITAYSDDYESYSLEEEDSRPQRPLLYLEKSHTYALEFESWYDGPTVSGTVELRPKAQNMDDVFTVSGDSLEEVKQPVVNLHIPEGVVDVSDGDKCFYDNYRGWGVTLQTITFPSTYGENDTKDLIEGVRGAAFDDDWVNGAFEPDCYAYHVATGNKVYKSQDGLVYTADGKRLVCVPDNYEGDDGTLTIPEGTRVIGDSAAVSADNIKTVVLPESLESMESNAFFLCDGITRIEINSNVDWVTGGWASITNCPNISEFVVGPKATQYEVKNGCLIRKNFYSYVDDDGNPLTCSGAILLISSDYDSEEFIIPDYVEYLAEGAIQGRNSSIKKLVIGKKCESIDTSNFYSLTDIKVASGNERFMMEENVLYSKNEDGLFLERFLYGHGVKKFTVKSNVCGLNSLAFYNGTDAPRDLESITFAGMNTFFSGNYIFASDFYGDENKLTLYGKDDSVSRKDYLRYEDDFREFNVNWVSTSPKTIKVTFNANGGKASVSIKNFEQGKAYGALPACTRANYKFLGWYTAKSGGTKVTAATKAPAKAAQTLYAHWESTVIKVSFNANGGKVSTKAKNLTRGKAYGTLPVPTRAKCFFLGWYTAKSGGTKVTAATKAPAKAAQTLYAHWAVASIKKASIKVTGSSTWNGLPQKPAIKVTFGGAVLKKGTDYTVSYSNNVEPGSKAKVTIKGKGVFGSAAGTSSALFTIKRATPTITVSKGVHEGGSYKKSRAYMAADAKQQDYLIYAAGKKGSTVAIAPKVILPSASHKSKEKDKVKLSFGTANKKTAKISSKTATQVKIKLVSPEETEITVKMAATKHYNAATYKFRVALKAKQSAQVINLTSSKLAKGKNSSTFSLRGSYQPVSLGVSVKGKAKYTCGVKNVGPVGAFSNGGDKITAPFAGKIEVKVTAKATNVYPSNTRTFTINVTGFAAKTDSTGNWKYAQDSDGNIIILKYLGAAKDVKVPAFKVGLSNKSVSEIAERAFEGSKITSITFGAGKGMNGYGTLKKIGKAAFKDCTALKTFVIPAGVTSIGDEAFYGCKSLTSLTLPEGVTKLGKATFRGCSGIAGVLDLPKNMTSIGDEAFYGCSKIEQLHMHKKLASIGKNAFGGCSGLKKVYSERGVADWKAISMGSGNTALTGSAVARYYNCGAGAAKATMADDALFASNPKALLNTGYDEISDRLLANALNAVSGVSFGQYAASYVKTATADAIGWPLRNFTEWALGGSWSEDDLAKKVALELLETNMKDVDNIDIHKDFSSDFKDKYDELRGYLKKIDGASSGLIYSSDDNRYQVAREINKLWGGTAEDMTRINDGLKKIGDGWDDTASTYLKKTGKDLDAVEFLLSYLELTEVGYERVSELMDIVPQDSQLYNGLDQIQASLLHPFSDYAVHYLLDEALSLETTAVEKLLGEGTQQVFKGRLKGATYVAIASYFYKAISAAMVGVPTMDDHYRAWFTVNNAMTLRNIADGYRADIIGAGGTSDEALLHKFRTARIYYYAALKQTVPYAITSSKNGNPLAADLLQIEYDKYTDALNWSGYLNSCKANAQGL